MRHLRFEAVCSNPGGGLIEGAVLWAYGPVGQTGSQRLVDMSCSAPVTRSHDALGNTVLKIALPSLPPHASRTLSLAFDVAMHAPPLAETLADPQDWRRSERLMDLGDERIQALARTLRQEGAAGTLRAIYEWVASRLAYADYTADDLGASEALRRMKGDCTEYAYLVTALARASGIPARVMGGFVVDRDDAPRAAQYHNWAEAHLEGAWRVVDAQKQVFLTPIPQYVAFRICSDRSLSALGQAHRFVVEGPVKIAFR